MRHFIHSAFPNNEYEVAILTKLNAFDKHLVEKHYINPISLDKENVVTFLLREENNKVSIKIAKEFLVKLLQALDNLGVKYLMVSESHYFKALTKKRKVEPHYGYAVPCTVEGYEHMKVLMIPSHASLFHKPANQVQITLALECLQKELSGLSFQLGEGIIHSETYPTSLLEIEAFLQRLHSYKRLSIDIETYGLNLTDGVATIGFAWSKHEGGVINIAFDDIPKNISEDIRDLLLLFFTSYEGEMLFHGASFDIKMLIKELFMQDLLDQAGLLYGLEALTNKFHDTKSLAYCAINSAAGNKLGLKDLAHEFAGNYAQEDIADITKIDTIDLLQYNLIDCLSTFYVFEKYLNLIDTESYNFYQEIMLKSLKVVIQMELTGMPMHPGKIQEARKTMMEYHWEQAQIVTNSQLVKDYEKQLRLATCIAANDKLKKKVRPIDEFEKVFFNPGSNKQVGELMHDSIGLPVMETTDTGLPATGADDLKVLIHKTKDPEVIKLLNALIEMGNVSKILNTFMPAFERGILKDDGMRYLHGNFNVTGTRSGRMSSSGPNLQNLPSTGTVYAKPVKECFQAPPGWLMVGADFNALEARVGALVTRDPNKLKIYTDGFDSHSLMAITYWPDAMPDIDPDDPDSVNTIPEKYKEYRQKSKTITFAAQYGGTYRTFMNSGFSLSEAQEIEKNYHKLYTVSDEWTLKRLTQASKDGYTRLAFGLKLNTPILSKVLFNSKSAPYEAHKEAKSVGNAMVQSYGLLNNRAAIELQERVLKSKYKYQIKPIAHIHDSQYFLVRNEVGVVKWFNDTLIDCMEFQKLPELRHDTVKLGAEMAIYYPSWKDEIIIGNKMSKKEILDLCEEKD